MKNFCPLILLFVFWLPACGPATPISYSSSIAPHPTVAVTSTPVAPPTALPTALPTQAAAGLVIITHELVGGSELDPLKFMTAQRESFPYGTLNRGNGEHFTFHWLETIPGLQLDAGQSRYIAEEHYNNDGSQGWVTLSKDGKEIYRIDSGPGSPISAVQGLWTYDNHWVLETNNYLDDAPFNGKIIEDGILLNEKNGYEEAFGFQTINERPFYFFKQNGLIDAWYDGQVIQLGYEKIPHYGCCSAGELNPRMWKNMVAFFGVRDDTWYFIQIGVPGSF